MSLLLTACKIMTAAVLLLHSSFGCSVHHASNCGMHRSIAQYSVQIYGHRVPRDVKHSHGCSCDHNSLDSVPDDETVVGSAVESCGCQRTPCDGNHAGCHSEVGCSFLATTDGVPLFDATFIGFVADHHDCEMLRNRLASWTDTRTQSTVGAIGSGARCALLGVWLI